jgi:hypothetical protein
VHVTIRKPCFDRLSRNKRARRHGTPCMAPEPGFCMPVVINSSKVAGHQRYGALLAKTNQHEHSSRSASVHALGRNFKIYNLCWEERTSTTVQCTTQRCRWSDTSSNHPINYGIRYVRIHGPCFTHVVGGELLQPATMNLSYFLNKPWAFLVRN